VNCRQTQNELVTRLKPGADVQKHLAGCEECRRFAADLQLVGTLRESPIATPVLLREQTLDRCHELLADKTATSRMSLWQRCRRICDSPQFVVTIAALGAIILGWWLAIQIPDIAEGSDSIMSIKLAFAQLGAQNFAAALLFPIVWKMRSNWRQRRDTQPS
jgi:hypothetical protein